MDEKNKGEENPQGVFTLRQGEFMQLFEEEPEGEYVYAVVMVPVPPLPEPSSSKALGLATVIAGKVRGENEWGYLHFEKDAKQEVASFLLDIAKADVGRWYFLKVTFGEPKAEETEAGE